jgi:hypothetical protein
MYRVPLGMRSGLFPAQQQMVGILPQRQYQDQAQARWYAQQANVATIPLRHIHGHSPTHTAPSITHYAHANVPTRSPLYAVPMPTVHSHRTGGGSPQGQGHYNYNSGHAVYARPMQMQAHQQYSSAPPAQAILSPINELSHVSPYLAQTPSENPNPGMAPSGSDINFSGASTSGEPLLPSQQTIMGDKTFWGQGPKPSECSAHQAARKSTSVGYERDLMLLQQRCRRQGAGEDVIGFLAKIFASGVNLEALTRPLTDSETLEFGVRAGKAYTAFLAPTNKGGGVALRYVCRLCHRDQAWKHSKDVLRHLRRDHFGLADVCKKWCVSNCRPLQALTRFLGMQLRKVLHERRNDQASL